MLAAAGTLRRIAAHMSDSLVHLPSEAGSVVIFVEEISLRRELVACAAWRGERTHARMWISIARLFNSMGIQGSTIRIATRTSFRSCGDGSLRRTRWRRASI
jgi:hypothetical protein